MVITGPNLVVISGDKEFSAVITNIIDYQNKLQEMVSDGIQNSIYKAAENNTLKDLKLV